MYGMLGSAWLTLRRAQHSLRTGRLEEAGQLLRQTDVREHRRSGELARELARQFVARGERYLRQDNTEVAWLDLLQAEALAADPSTERLRQPLTRLGLAEVQALLEAGEPLRAVETAGRLHDRAVRHPELPPLADAARAWAMAREMADRGEFALARQALDRGRPTLPMAGLARFREELEGRQALFVDRVAALHGAVESRDWREVVRLSDELLVIAPQCQDARTARARAWKVASDSAVPSAAVNGAAPKVDASPVPSKRFLLWIDGIGGYLVCLSPRVTLGQAAPDAAVDVPLVADVSRLHATLTRDAEGYLLEAARDALVNGKPVGKALLQPGDRVTLGSACQMLFQQPVPVSATARLELTSGQRLPLSVDGVLLMADTLVMGPGPQAHVIAPDLLESVVLFRHKDGLGVRWPGEFTSAGQRCRDRAMLGPQATASGEGLTFTVEPVGKGKL